jgi:hypothetical protein
VIEGLQYVQLPDKTYGEMKVAIAIPRPDDNWGVLAPLRDTLWGGFIATVSGEAMAHARHGFSAPLMREIGPHPQERARRMSDAEGRCANFEGCAGAAPVCRPGRKLPDCYEPPGIRDVDTLRLVAAVSLAWRDGWYVIVVVGPEFNLR